MYKRPGHPKFPKKSSPHLLVVCRAVKRCISCPIDFNCSLRFATRVYFLPFYGWNWYGEGILWRWCIRYSAIICGRRRKGLANEFFIVSFLQWPLRTRLWFSNDDHGLFGSPKWKKSIGVSLLLCFLKYVDGHSRLGSFSRILLWTFSFPNVQGLWPPKMRFSVCEWMSIFHKYSPKSSETNLKSTSFWAWLCTRLRLFSRSLSSSREFLMGTGPGWVFLYGCWALLRGTGTGWVFLYECWALLRGTGKGWAFLYACWALLSGTGIGWVFLYACWALLRGTGTGWAFLYACWALLSGTGTGWAFLCSLWALFSGIGLTCSWVTASLFSLMWSATNWKALSLLLANVWGVLLKFADSCPQPNDIWLEDWGRGKLSGPSHRPPQQGAISSCPLSCRFVVLVQRYGVEITKLLELRGVLFQMY